MDRSARRALRSWVARRGSAARGSIKRMTPGVMRGDEFARGGQTQRSLRPALRAWDAEMFFK